MSEIQRADPSARKRAILIVVGAGVLGMILIPLADSYRPVVTRWLQEDPSQTGSRASLILALLAGSALIPLLGFAAYLYRTGAIILRAERFPVPGTAVTRDTPVLRGADARRHGRTVQVVALLLVLAAVGLALALWRVAATIGIPSA